MTDNKHCFGCVAYNTLSNPKDKVQCAFSFSNIDGRCPCTTCIVKVLCNEICDLFVDYCDKTRRDVHDTIY